MDKPTDYESVFRSSNLLRGTNKTTFHLKPFEILKNNLKKIIPAIASIIVFSSVFILVILRSPENPESKLQMSPRSYLYYQKFIDLKPYESIDVSSSSFVTNVRVNKMAGVSEPKIVCNPVNENILAVTTNDFSLTNISARIFISEDKGINWEAKEIPLSGKFNESFYSDPWLDYDMNGNLYFVSVQKDNKKYSREAIYFNSSADNGTVWDREILLSYNSKESIHLDRPKICIDKTSSRINSIYITWIEIRGLKSFIMFSKSTDGGNTFTSPVSIENYDVDYCSVVCGQNGELFVAYLKDENKICIKKSTDAGESWFKPGCIDIIPSGIKYENQFVIKKFENEGVRINSEPNLAVTAENDLIITYSAKDKNEDAADVYFAKIHKTGEVSIPVKVNTDKTINDQYFPTITADESDNIFILYQDSRNDESNVLTETYVAVSTDGGLSFKDEKLSTSDFNPSSVAVAKYFGDYNSCVVSEGKFIGVWTDGRNNCFDVYAGMFDIKDLIESKK